MDSPWWRVTFTPTHLPAPEAVSDFLDGLGFELIELGATSTSIESPPDITCFVRGSAEECRSFLERAATLPLTLLEKKEVNESNWNEGCPEVWVPVHAGTFCIVPVTGPSDPRPAPTGALKIIPGQGFGTGHHATTKMVLEALDELLVNQGGDLPLSSQSRILDFGTGSGVLAIAAASRLGAMVEATDIDTDALQNAADNSELNGVSHLLSLSQRPLASLTGPYDLLLANVYAEVLVSSQEDLTRLARPRARILMSGVTELVKDHVVDSFCKDGEWVLLSERSANDWMGIVLQRVSNERSPQ